MGDPGGLMGQYDSFDVAQAITTWLDRGQRRLIRLRMGDNDHPYIGEDHQISRRDAGVQEDETKSADMGAMNEQGTETINSSSECGLTTSAFLMSCFGVISDDAVTWPAVNASIPCEIVSIENWPI
jgi:hypothetical protein